MSSRLKSATRKLRLKSIRDKLHKKTTHRDHDDCAVDEQDPVTAQQQCGARPELQSANNFAGNSPHLPIRVSIRQRSEYLCSGHVEAAREQPEGFDVPYEMEDLESTKSAPSATIVNLPRAQVVRDVPKFFRDAKRGGPSRITTIQRFNDLDCVAKVPVHYGDSHMSELESLWFQNFGTTDQKADIISISSDDGEGNLDESNSRLGRPKPSVLKRFLSQGRKRSRKQRKQPML